MKKLFFSFLLFILANFLVCGQDTTVTVSKNRYANFDVGIGYLNTDLSKVNASLAGYGYKPLSENFATLSVSPSFFINRFLLRAEYTWQLPVITKQEDNVTSTFGGRHMSIGLGYVIIQKPTYRVFPYISLSSFTSRLAVREKTSASTMDDLTDNQQRSFHLYFSNASLDIGLQIEKHIGLKNRKWDCPQNSTFMTLGLRIGYLIGPGDVKGRFNNTTIADAPTYSPNGPYIKLVAGFGTKMRDLKWKR